MGGQGNLERDTTGCSVEVLLYVHRNRRFIRDGSPGRPPRLSHRSRALSGVLLSSLPFPPTKTHARAHVRTHMRTTLLRLFAFKQFFSSSSRDALCHTQSKLISQTPRKGHSRDMLLLCNVVRNGERETGVGGGGGGRGSRSKAEQCCIPLCIYHQQY